MYTRSLAIRVIDEYAETLSPSTGKGVPDEHPEYVRMVDFLSLLPYAPGLRQLHLSVVWSQRNRIWFEPSILDWLSSLALPIEVLDLKYSKPLESPVAYDLVRLWPTIRALRVHTDYGMPLPERPSTRLRELRLPITSLAAVIEWFLPPIPRQDRSDLRVLELYEIPEDGHGLLSAYAPNVSSLTLSRQPATRQARLASTPGPGRWSRDMTRLP